MVGADLKNLVNEAALLAAHRGHDQVTMPDFTDSLEKITLGTVRGIVLDRAERESAPRQGNRSAGHAPRPVRMKDLIFPNGPGCSGPVRRQTADATMNRSGRTRIAPPLAIWRWRSQVQRGSYLVASRRALLAR
jgi:hypothetical protein